ncbi:hypothetical protein I6F35_33270 [Bradyrhizobium sp. BRP22]|nr:hypothetical protein [Bradyrhizobium sp. BRP22]
MTPLVISYAPGSDNASGSSDSDQLLPVVASLRLIYLLLAVGVALTKHRYVALTSARIRHASRLTSPSEPERTAGTLAICLLVAAFGCASFALQPPPDALTAMNWHLGAHEAGPIVWPALMSLGVAGFGSSAHAVVDAYRA